MATGARPNNQSSKKAQLKIAKRIKAVKEAGGEIPKFMEDFIKSVDENNGKAKLKEMKMDICHITPIDTIKKTLAAGLSQRDTMSKRAKTLFGWTVREAISSDDDEDAMKVSSWMEEALDPKTPRNKH